MKKLLLLAVLVVASAGNLFAQGKIDTLYYTKDWKCAPHKAFASYYRVAFYPTNAALPKQYRDYYITDEVRGGGNFIKVDAVDDANSVFDGECTTYYKSGQVETVRNYKNGVLEGKFCTYQEDGLIKTTGSFCNGKLSGLYTEFLKDGAFVQFEYLDGKSVFDYYVKGDSKGNLTKFRIADNAPVWETPSVNERTVEFRDGTPWQIYYKNGVRIALTNRSVRDYGKWHRLDMEISNYTIDPIEFTPEESITATSVNAKAEVSNLAVWSAEEYLKKVNRTQIFAAVMLGVAEGLATMDAGHSASKTTTYHSNGTHSTSYTRAYSPTVAYQSRVLSAYHMATFTKAMSESQEFKKLGYLKKNTINPGEAVSGYVHVKRKKGEKVQFVVKIEGADYTFDWDFGKKRKNKK